MYQQKVLMGRLVFYQNHISLISELDNGNLIWRNNNNEEDIFIQGGFIEIIDNKVTILVDGSIK